MTHRYDRNRVSRFSGVILAGALFLASGAGAQAPAALDGCAAPSRHRSETLRRR